MNGVAHAEHQLSGHDRANTLSTTIAVTNAVNDHAVSLQNIGGNCGEGRGQILCRRAGNFDGGLNVPVAAALVVIDVKVPQAFDQAREVVQDMPVMRSNRRSPRPFFLLRIGVLVDAVKQRKPLAQYILRSRDEC